MIKIAIDAVALVAAVPLAKWALRLAKRYRRTAQAAATLLLLFGLNIRVDPPPPPRTEAVERDEAAAKDDEPK